MAKLIGTAGHVDHGKTTLIRALTGIDADRLPEEKQRGMTIDIGFAYIDLPGLERVSIVDVPGHERFISNMLVGALGIDAALLCVAADESVKPQTREHLQILELLPVERLVVALTRADLADAETRELATMEVSELLASSRFEKVPVIAVSAETGEGLSELKAELAKALEGPKKVEGPWYLPIDRAFSVKGHGCVVTGTLARGEVRVGETAFLEPGHREVRVRGIHSHGDDCESSEAGRRTALNLGGIKLEEVERGQAVGTAGSLFETTCLDARVHWVADCKHAERVRLSIGAAEVLGRLFKNEEDPGLIQLRLDHPIACALDQPLIIRKHSPPRLLCGGKVVVPQAVPRRKSEKVKAVEGKPDREAILELVATQELTTDEICRRLGKTPQSLGDTFESLIRAKKLLGFAGLWFTPEVFKERAKRFLETLAEAHRKQPTHPAHPRERIVSEAKLGWAGKPLDRILALLAESGKIEVNGTSVRLVGFKVKFTDRQRVFLDRIKAELEKEPINTPNPHRLSQLLNVPMQAVEEVLKLGVQADEVVGLDDGVFYTHEQIARIKERVKEAAKGQPFTAAEMRDALGATRKYVIPLLEYLDKQRFTTRVGDKRMLNR